MNPGDRLKEIRRSLKISLEEAAEKSGVSRSAIQRYESGEVRAFTSEYMNYMYKLGFSVNWILFGIEPKNLYLTKNVEINLSDLVGEVKVLSDRISYLERIITNMRGDEKGVYGSDIIKSRVIKEEKKAK